MRLLDLFCGEGGAAMGYHRAGFDVVGVDIVRRPRYPFEFHQADALTFPLDGFDAVHASPPCQAYSVTRHSHHTTHPELVVPTRDRLERSGLPYVMENVPGAPLRDYVILCGAAFGCEATDRDGRPLVLRRHRLFESNVMLWAPPPCACGDYRRRRVRIGGVYGGGSESREAAGRRGGGYTPPVPVRAELIGADWMTRDGLSQAIPPAYTEWIGAQLLTHLGAMT